MGEMIMKSIVEIKKLDHQGRGIGKIDGKVIFVANTCIGEEVEVEVIKNSSKYMEGRVTKILKKSSDRINFSCPYYIMYDFDFIKSYKDLLPSSSGTC